MIRLDSVASVVRTCNGAILTNLHCKFCREEEYTDEEFEEEEAEGEGRASGIQGALEEDEDEEEEEDEDESDGETGPNDDLTRKDDLATNEFFVDEILTEGLPEGFEGVPTKARDTPTP